mgnify:CR=1 FL=1
MINFLIYHSKFSGTDIYATERPNQFKKELEEHRDLR